LFDQLRMASGQYEHIFVFGHAPLLTSSENHGPTSGAQQIRALLEGQGVEVYFNGHNHHSERTHRVRADGLDPTGTAYITVGSGGALTDTLSGDWSTAFSYREWTSYGNQEAMTTYLKITVDGSVVRGEVVSLGDGVVDSFTL
jgi:hypothetical protein